MSQVRRRVLRPVPGRPPLLVNLVAESANKNSLKPIE